MVWVVCLRNGGFDYWLRRTVWAGGRDRADEFATEADARAAWEKAKKFTKAGLRRAVEFKEVEKHVG